LNVATGFDIGVPVLSEFGISEGYLLAEAQSFIFSFST